MTRDFSLEEAIERYLKERKPNVSDSTLYNIGSALRQFVSYCDDEGVTDVAEIDPFLISDFRLERQEEVSANTVYNNLSALRTFLGWCEGRDIIDGDISENMILPDDRDQSKDEYIEPERAEEILAYYRTYKYASLRHALFALLWNTGIRIGAARSLDVENFSPDGNYIELEHKPNQDTPLKNGEKSERQVNLSSSVAEVLKDYIDARRNEVSDDYGNRPLFASTYGRMHRTTLRKKIVKMTRPCFYGNGCPHDREIDECEATEHDWAARCPSSVSPHPIRRSAITHWLDEGHPKELLSDRMDVSTKVLEEHLLCCRVDFHL